MFALLHGDSYDAGRFLGQGSIFPASFSFNANDAAFDSCRFYVYVVGFFQEPFRNDGERRCLYITLLSAFEEGRLCLQPLGIRFLLPALLPHLAAADHHELIKDLLEAEDTKHRLENLNFECIVRQEGLLNTYV